jgi:Reverse transcriptase (RNA-dependent DNA polymerase)
MACVQSSKFRIKLNGSSGGGFISPSRGLRQGYPLSPYLFILAMEPLTRKLNDAQVRGVLRGAVLAPGAPPLTHYLYADDVVLFGEAGAREAQALAEIMDLFGRLSGLRINNDKFIMWFSSCTGQQRRMAVLRQLPAGSPTDDTVYLGYPMPKGALQCKHYRKMSDQMQNKFGGWVMNLLSHAGRLTLIQSVLQTIPIYYMGAQVLPKTVIKQLEAIIRRFFWGKTNKTHYLAYTAWDRICTDKEDGGLGLRKLETLNKAMVLKAFWTLVNNPQHTWSQVCMVKYLRDEGSTFWTVVASPANSTLWQKIIQTREKILQNYTIKLGSGEDTRAVGAPWFSGWNEAALKALPSAATVSLIFLLLR